VSSLRDQLHDALPIAAQNLGSSMAGYLKSRTRFSPYFYEALQRLERSVDDPLVVHRARQFRLLRRMLDQARVHTRYHADLPPAVVRPDPAEAIHETLARIEPLSKDAYLEHFEELKADDVARSRVFVTSTSGTTGTALPVWTSRERVAEEYACVWRQRRGFGVDIDAPHMNFTGSIIVPRRQTRPPFWRTNHYWRQTLFSIFHMSPQNLQAYVAQIHRTPAVYAQGYPSALHLVGRALLEEGRALPKGRLKAVFTSSESLLPFQREVIEEAFGAPVRDFYHATEQVVSMTACRLDRLHVDMEFCIVELEVQEETDEYERGPLLATALGNPAMPLFRYRLGDVGTRLKGACECGRPGDAFLEIDGRIEDYVVTPRGERVGRVDHVFKQQFDVAEAQIVQDRIDGIELFVVPKESFGEHSREQLLRAVREYLGDELEIGLHLVDSIPREENGKFRAVRSSVARLRDGEAGAPS